MSTVSAYAGVAGRTALVFAVGALAFWGFTRGWGRALSYAVGSAAVVLVVESVRAHRGRDREDAPDESGPEERPRLFGNG